MSVNGVGGSAPMVRTFQPPSFSSIDRDSSGSISLEELSSATGASDSKSAERAKKLFAAMDGDNSGTITSAEKDAFDEKIEERRSAMQFTAQLFSNGRPPSNDDVFAATDADSDGSVSLAEFSASDAAENLSTDDLSKLFEFIDSDGDGAISESESSSFLEAVKEAAGGSDRPGPPAGGHGRTGGPGGPPPGGSAASDSEDVDSTKTVLDLLTAATKAYSVNNNNSNNLLATINAIFDQAA